MRRLAFILVAGLILTLSVVSVRKSSKPRAAKASEQLSSNRISCLGRVVPGEKLLRITGAYNLYGPGIVSELLVKRGEKVRKNAVLAKLQSYALAEKQMAHAEAEATVAQRVLEQVKAGEKQSAIAAQQALVLKCEAELKNAQAVFNRDQQLFADKAISPNDFDRSELALRIAQNTRDQATNTLESLKEVRAVDVKVAEAQLASARAAAGKMKAELEQNLIRAPMDGVILEIRTYPGEALDKEPLLYMGDLENIRVEAEVYVTDIAGVKTGARAVITGQGLNGVLEGTVKELARQVDQSAIFDPDPASFSDKRIVKVWIVPSDSAMLAGLINHQVDVAIVK